MSRRPQFPRQSPRPTGASGASSPVGSPAAPSDDETSAALEFLGLPGDAASEDIEAAHDAVVAYLASAPRPLWGWARAQAAIADDAYVTLTDPTARRSSGALSGATARSVDSLGGPATPPARRAPSSTDASDAGDADDFEAMLAEVTPSLHRESIPAGRADDRPAPAARAATRAAAAQPQGRGIPRAAIAGAVVVLAIAVGAGVYVLGGGGGDIPVASSAPTAEGLDMEAVAQYMQAIAANPNDTAALLGLGDVYFQAGDYTTAATWLNKVLTIDPKNVQALLALGAADFNLGDTADAKTLWLQVVDIDPGNVEAHYDLGFLYFNASPQDVAGVQAEWGKVIELDPESDIATIVKAHLDSLSSPAPSGEATAAPSGAASEAPSPAASAAPTPGATK